MDEKKETMRPEKDGACLLCGPGPSTGTRAHDTTHLALLPVPLAVPSSSTGSVRVSFTTGACAASEMAWSRSSCVRMWIWSFYSGERAARRVRRRAEHGRAGRPGSEKKRHVQPWDDAMCSKQAHK